MRKMTGLHSRIAVLMLLMALLAACGSKSTTATSTTTPSVTYVDSVALKSGIPYTWGGNTYGQLGNNNTDTKSTPIPVALTGITGISAGGTHTLALTSGGAVWAWGNNGFGQVGDNTTTIHLQPVTALLGTVITAISAGGNFSLARDSSNSVWAWGDNQFGQLGVDLNTLPYRYTAGQVNDPTTHAPLANIAKIAAGGAYSLALTTAETVQSWGLNNVGQLGRTTPTSYAPGAVTIAPGSARSGVLPGVVDLAAGGAHSLFVLSDGTVWACGHNLLGQLGLGGADVTDRTLGVVQVTTFPATAGISLTKYPFQAAAGLDHSLVIISDGTLSSPLKGTVWAWGNNNSLGNGTLLPGAVAVTTPGQVLKGPGSPLTDIIKIIAIGDHSLALDSSGQLWAWGDNAFGQLGLGDLNNRNYATPITTLTGADLYHP